MQTWIWFFLVLLLAPGTLFADADEDKMKLESAAIVQEFGKNLKDSLVSVITKGGVVGAIGFCRSASPELAQEHSKPGYEVGRTSHRLRNPANAPKEWMKPVLQEFSQSSSLEPKEAILTKVDEKKWGYAEPIYVTTLCLKCHGDAVKEDVKEAILARYPHDQAIGFKKGEFRGMFWVEMTQE